MRGSLGIAQRDRDAYCRGAGEEVQPRDDLQETTTSAADRAVHPHDRAKRPGLFDDDARDDWRIGRAVAVLHDEPGTVGAEQRTSGDEDVVERKCIGAQPEPRGAGVDIRAVLDDLDPDDCRRGSRSGGRAVEDVLARAAGRRVLEVGEEPPDGSVRPPVEHARLERPLASPIVGQAERRLVETRAPSKGHARRDRLLRRAERLRRPGTDDDPPERLGDGRVYGIDRTRRGPIVLVSHNGHRFHASMANLNFGFFGL